MDWLTIKDLTVRTRRANITALLLASMALPQSGCKRTNTVVKSPKTQLLKLSVSCNDADAEVWGSGRYLGLCKEARFIVNASDSPFRLEVHADGYFSYYRLLSTDEWPTETLHVELVRGLDIDDQAEP